MLGLVILATIIRIAMSSLVVGAQFPTFFLAVILSTFLGGTLVGLASVGVSTLAAWLSVPPPACACATAYLGEAYSLGAFAAVGALMVFTIGSLQDAVLGLEESRNREALLEARSRAAEELHRWIDVFENVAIGISVIDPVSDNIRFANRAFANLHGMSFDRLPGVSLYDLYPPGEREHVAAMVREGDRTGHTVFTANRRRQDGSIFPARVHATSVRRGGCELLYRIVTVSDISAERELEAELHQAQRVEAIGQLTAGVAHDFNNLLQGIIANLELLDDEIQDRPGARGFLASVLRIAEHGGELTRHLLSFARQQVLRPEPLDLGRFLEEFHDTLCRTLDPRIKVATSVEQNLPPVLADASHLHTALLNLAINARDAMPSGGDLHIEALSSASRMVVIRVRDTGTGIAPEILAKVYEPFFTTKGLNGSGLGLSMVYGFAGQSGGDLRIESELGRGTCAHLQLPLARATVEDGPDITEGP
jgi:PAS domain S-box-containing protein